MALCHSEAARYLQFLSVPFLSQKAKADVQASQRRKFHSAYYVIPSTARDLQLPTKSYYVYTMASRSLNLYTGVPNSIYCPVLQHKKDDIEGFTKRYNINRLVYYEVFHHMGHAIAREKRIKSWTRAKRLALIASKNSTWQDLAEGWEKGSNYRSLASLGMTLKILGASPKGSESNKQNKKAATLVML